MIQILSRQDDYLLTNEEKLDSDEENESEYDCGNAPTIAGLSQRN